MEEKIILKMSIFEILSKYQQCWDIFANYNIEVFDSRYELKDELKEMILENKLKEKQINPRVFISILKEKMTYIEEMRGFSQQDKYYKSDDVNLLAFPPCPLYSSFLNHYVDFIDKHNKTSENKINFPIKEKKEFQKYKEPLEFIDDINRFPDVLIENGLGTLFDKKWLNSNKFIKYSGDEKLCLGEESSLNHPQVPYTIISFGLWVVLVDHTKLKDLPVPKSWKEIMSPIYRKNIALHGHEDTFCDMMLLLYIYKEFGFKGIEEFADNLKHIWCGYEITENMGTNYPPAAAINIVSNHLIEKVKNKDNISVIYPEEGAIISPLFLAVKVGKNRKGVSLISEITSEETGGILAKGNQIPIYSEENTDNIEDIPLNWLGWDFILNNNIPVLKKMIQQKFVKARNKKSCSGCA